MLKIVIEFLPKAHGFYLGTIGLICKVVAGRISFYRMLAFLLFATCGFLQLWVSAKLSLHKGQAIKQAHSYSITQSLSEIPLEEGGLFALFSTSLPCPDPRAVDTLGIAENTKRPWAEEPPVFHFFAASLMKLGIEGKDKAFVFPLLVHLALWPLFFLIFGLFASTRPQRVWWASFAFLSPIWVRYGVQHLPDTLATLFLVASYWALLRTNKKLFYVLGVLAVSTKALCLVPLIGIVLAKPLLEVIREPSSLGAKFKILFPHLLSLLLMSLPFFVWMGILIYRDIPNPFFNASSVAGVAELRHTGSWGYLLEIKYWSRFVTWNIVKGCGLIAFLMFIDGLWRAQRENKWIVYTPELLGWIFMIIPYWIFIRDGNYVHDYYALPFVPALMIFCAIYIGQFTDQNKWRLKFLPIVLPLASMVLGFSQIYSLSKNPVQPVDFCNAEASHYSTLKLNDDLNAETHP